MSNDQQISLNGKIWKELKDISEKLKSSRGEEEISQSILEGVRKLCQPDFLNLPTRFSNVFKQFQRHEGILYTLPYYRDHFIHMFHVFYLGYLILNGWWNNKVSFLEYEDEARKNEIIKTWFIASIQHDIAYPIEMAEYWVPRFPKDALDLDVEIQSIFDWTPIILAKKNISHIDNMLEKFIYPLKNTSNKNVIRQIGIAFKKWFNEQLLVKHDHGALGSLSLLSFEWPKADLDCAYDAALSVILHNYWKNLDDTLGQLTFTSYPISFLLTYCDTVQEWGRTQATPHNGIHTLVDPPTKFSGLEMESQGTVVVLSYHIKEHCRERVENWSRLDELAQNKRIDQQKNKIRKDIDAHINPVRLAWSRGKTSYRFEIKAEDDDGIEFYKTPII